MDRRTPGLSTAAARYLKSLPLTSEQLAQVEAKAMGRFADEWVSKADVRWAAERLGFVTQKKDI